MTTGSQLGTIRLGRKAGTEGTYDRKNYKGNLRQIVTPTASHTKNGDKLAPKTKGKKHGIRYLRHAGKLSNLKTNGRGNDRNSRRKLNGVYCLDKGW